MKLNRLFRFLLLLCVVSTVSIHSRGQSTSPTNGLSIKVSPGILSFFGDMSVEDYNPVKVLQN
ncbi:MAG: hypothetical protein J7L77_06285, partial [Clostridiales bacterium]|nr:hypothetical protein [Clostridiales bacterium]